MTDAERARRYRDRLRSGRLLATFEVPPGWAMEWIEAGYLDEAASHDHRQVGEAFVRAIEDGWRPSEKNVTA